MPAEIFYRFPVFQKKRKYFEPKNTVREKITCQKFCRKKILGQRSSEKKFEKIKLGPEFCRIIEKNFKQKIINWQKVYKGFSC